MSKKSKVNPKHKKKRKFRNWREYEASLVQRGSLTLWLSEDAIAQWLAPKTGSPGRPKLYSDLAIQTILSLQYIYGLAQRKVIGFVTSLFALMGVDLLVPDKSRLSRRAKDIDLSFRDLRKGAACSDRRCHRSLKALLISVLLAELYPLS